MSKQPSELKVRMDVNRRLKDYVERQPPPKPREQEVRFVRTKIQRGSRG